MKMTKTAPTDFYASFWSAVTQGAAPLEAFDQADAMFPGTPTAFRPGETRESRAMDLARQYAEFPQLRPE
jgi:fructoselysine-6-P-deglycase FrlB-like protein